MVMMALSAGLDSMVLASWVVENTSIVQNFQYVDRRLKYCAGEQAQEMSLDRGKKLEKKLNASYDLKQKAFRPSAKVVLLNWEAF